MTRYRHFELLKFCDWIDWWGTGYFLFEVFEFGLRFSAEPEEGEFAGILLIGLLGFGLTIQVGRWEEYSHRHSTEE